MMDRTEPWQTKLKTTHQDKSKVVLVLSLIFAEALGLYGLIVGLVVASGAGPKNTDLCTDYA